MQIVYKPFTIMKIYEVSNLHHLIGFPHVFDNNIYFMGYED